VKLVSNYHKRCSQEFKAEAVRLLLTSGETAEDLGRELGWRALPWRNGKRKRCGMAITRKRPSQFYLGER